MKNLPAMQETWVRSLGGEDPLEKEVATHSSIPAWRIPCTEEPGRLQSMGSQRVRHDSAIKKKNCSITEYWKIVLEVFENDFDVSYFGGHLKTLL